jgi:hypothetical protein
MEPRNPETLWGALYSLEESVFLAGVEICTDLNFPNFFMYVVCIIQLDF